MLPCLPSGTSWTTCQPSSPIRSRRVRTELPRSLRTASRLIVSQSSPPSQACSADSSTGSRAPTPGVGALDPVDESALQAWLGGDDWDSINLAAIRGERGSSVRTRLERMGDEGWQVVHDVPLGRQGSMVEHLLIGPAGIFTVAERRHPGQRVVVDGRTLVVDGRSMSYLRDARLEATRVQGALLAAACAAITVRGVVVVHGDLEVRTVQPQHDAFAIARQDVQTVFRAMPVRLDPARIMAIAHVARQRSTWSR